MTERESVARWQLADASKADHAHAPTAHEQEVIQLFDELRNGLLRYLASLGLPMQDGEEVIQEAFLALFQHLQRGKPRSNLRGWIFRVSHNLGVKRRLSLVREIAIGEQELMDQADPAENPEEQCLSSQRMQRLQSVLQALPELDRCCLSLRAEGLRYREISEVLGVSLGSVAESLRQSIARFSRAEGV